jgi:hypothetical protein
MPRMLNLNKRRDASQGVLSRSMAEDLKWFLPPLQKESLNWELEYSSVENGISFKTLLSRASKGPLMLVLRSMSNEVFGAFLSNGISIQRGYYGNGQCFLWRYDSPTKKLSAFLPTGDNDYFMVTEDSFFAMGGGAARFGLWFDSDLWKGHSDPCATFNNLPLAKDSDFEIQALELWSFKL